jgi:hypothetical protein
MQRRLFIIFAALIACLMSFGCALNVNYNMTLSDTITELTSFNFATNGTLDFNASILYSKQADKNLIKLYLYQPTKLNKRYRTHGAFELLLCTSPSSPKTAINMANFTFDLTSNNNPLVVKQLNIPNAGVWSMVLAYCNYNETDKSNLRVSVDFKALNPGNRSHLPAHIEPLFDWYPKALAKWCFISFVFAIVLFGSSSSRYTTPIHVIILGVMMLKTLVFYAIYVYWWMYEAFGIPNIALVCMTESIWTVSEIYLFIIVCLAYKGRSFTYIIASNRRLRQLFGILLFAIAVLITVSKFYNYYNGTYYVVEPYVVPYLDLTIILAYTYLVLFFYDFTTNMQQGWLFLIAQMTPWIVYTTARTIQYYLLLYFNTETLSNLAFTYVHIYDMLLLASLAFLCRPCVDGLFTLNRQAIQDNRALDLLRAIINPN